ncbi:hypothetical protein [Acetobacter persici]|uniref:hypothetical protein n=1 Tax=Acetobacter persici TaxID=1076596 RepID=UPI001F1A1C0B|nr:hypothetical protein [Acetobacter persici]MCG0998165.1 hypothetical protein [Acetobacter persici]
MPDNIDNKSEKEIEPSDEKDQIYINRRSKFTKFLSEKVKSVLICPVCNNNGNFDYIGYKDQFPTLPVNSLGRYYKIHSLSCPNCGYILSFMDMDTVKQEAKENE